MKSKSNIGLVTVIFLSMIFTVVGCASPGTPATSTPAQVPYEQKVEDFIKNSSTFKFDGIANSIKFTKIIGSTNGTSTEPTKDWEFTVESQTGHPGHGDRTGQALAQVITKHTAVVKIKAGEIVSAVCDNENIMIDNPSNNEEQAAVVGAVVGPTL
jgi:hypothetical protein